MKLFLASSLDKTLSLLLPKLAKPIEETKVLFVANAADPYKDKWWEDLDRKAFAKAGFQLTAIELGKVSDSEFTQYIAKADILHICGGSVFYLLSLLKQKGFDRVIIDSVRNSKILYTA